MGIPSPEPASTPSNFIRDIIDQDLESGRHTNVVTRFPPEPNGYLHIGHAKSIVLNFGIAKDYDGRCHLRFDDTNPETESEEYAESICESVRWLGYEWDEHLYYASDYFELFYEYALKLIRKGLAYVDSLDEETIREYRGTVLKPGKESPYRSRSVEENLDLFRRMREGEFANGEHVLRARIDMASQNMKMRDPLLYRIKHAEHYRSGDDWCIYPMYDLAHPLEDAIENVTHSLCTLEFDNNRELYDWVLENCLEPEELPTRPRQYEFSRLNLDYTVMSKRKLLQLVDGGFVDGWDDPRMPTLAGVRRRGITPEAVRNFAEAVGVTKVDGRTDIGLFEHTIRDSLNHEAPRVMAVVDPLKVTITNFPEGEVDEVEASYWPHDVPKEGSRRVPFTRELYIERSDFMEEPVAGFYRLAPGREVRLRYAYFITCHDVVKDDSGNVIEVLATYDPESRGGDAPDGRKVRGTLHWVSAGEGVPAEFRLYDRLFKVADPDSAEPPFTDHLNEASLTIRKGFVEPSVLGDEADTRYQFERLGYFWQDPVDSTSEQLVFNRIVSLRDSWSGRGEAKAKAEPQKPKRKPNKQGATSGGRRDPVELLDDTGLARFGDLQSRYKINRDDAAVLAADPVLTDFFRSSASESTRHQAVANWILHEVRREMKARGATSIDIAPADFVRLVELVEEATINSSAGQRVLAAMMDGGGAPDEIVEREGLIQESDTSALAPIVDMVLSENEAKVAEYRGGKTGVIGFFMGQVMRRTHGRANPQVVQALLRERLDA